MKLVYLYDDGSKLSVTGKSERDCADKIRNGAELKRAEGKTLVQVERPRAISEIVVSS